MREVTLKPLLLVLILTAIATSVAMLLPPASELVPLALLLDSVPFAGCVAATVLAATRLRRISLPAGRWLIAIYGYFAGGLIGALGVAHLAAIVVEAIEAGRQQQFAYDFRFYSLVLLGVLLLGSGVIAAQRAVRLAHGQDGAWRASLWIWTAILAINLPLAPLQGFAVAFTLLAAIELLLLGVLRTRTDRPRENSSI